MMSYWEKLPKVVDRETITRGVLERTPLAFLGDANMVRVGDILTWLDERAPCRYKASWDQCGLQVGDPQAVLRRILVALDPSTTSLEEAESRGCDCLVTHHPLLLHAINSIHVDHFPGNVIARALCKGIHLIAAHTNMDVAREGTNDQLARLLSLCDVRALEVDDAWREESRYGGMGRVGRLPDGPVPLERLAEKTRTVLGATGVRVVGNRSKQVEHIALCTGSGGSLMETVIETGCDAYVTGDVKYHEAQRAVEAELAVIDVGHFASERIVVQPIVDYLRSCAAQAQVELEVLAAGGERDPFWVLGENKTVDS